MGAVEEPNEEGAIVELVKGEALTAPLWLKGELEVIGFPKGDGDATGPAASGFPKGLAVEARPGAGDPPNGEAALSGPGPVFAANGDATGARDSCEREGIPGGAGA